MSTHELTKGDVIEVLEVRFLAPDAWIPATIIDITDYRVDVVLQGGENKGHFLVLQRHMQNRTWRA